jgi:subtilase family serine protease
VQETNQGFAAAGLRGISIMVSSGDSGAHGRTDDGCSTPKTRPDWPTASPYILAVGATALKKGTAVPLASPKSPFCLKPPITFQKCASSGTEIVASTATGALIVSGGGFSNVASTPAWQAAAVKTYLAAGGLLPPAKTDYNATGRAYPDVSALGHNYPILASQAWVAVDGTSCSSPVFASIIALANSARLAAGKKTLGFVNPAIYQIAASTPTAFNDVTLGDNKCTEQGCAAGCTGFGAVKGFDAATGFGTPNIPILVAALAAL